MNDCSLEGHCSCWEDGLPCCWCEMAPPAQEETVLVDHKELERLYEIEQRYERLVKVAKKLVLDLSGNDVLSAMVLGLETELEEK